MEDTACCRLGILDANMSMLYGEGKESLPLPSMNGLTRPPIYYLSKQRPQRIFTWLMHGYYQPGLLADRPAALQIVNVSEPQPYAKAVHHTS